jgi:glycosyltransferase involved in cell wall biosynthesis
MHICLLTPSFPPLVDGGVAISTGRLVERLLLAGHRLTVVTLPPAQPGEPSGAPARPGGQGLSVSYTLVEDPVRDPMGVAAFGERLHTQHQQHSFDVLLAYFVYPSGYLAVVSAERLGVPVVCSCRGNDISKDMFIDPEPLATVLQRSTRLIFVCDSLRRMADTLVPCYARSTVIANAIDSTLFMPRQPATLPQPQPVTVGISGIMRWKKGLDLFLPLLHSLCALHDIRVLIAGYGLDAAVEKQLADFVAQHRLQHRVEVTGPLPHEHMPRALQRMDIYVNTSYQEGMPNSVLEAMACALPVVATDADGTSDLVVDGVTGFVCGMGDLHALRRGCRRLIEEPALRQRLGRAGRARVQQLFSPEREAAAVEAVLRQACNENRET